jgi:hypothetical protein
LYSKKKKFLKKLIVLKEKKDKGRDKNLERKGSEKASFFLNLRHIYWIQRIAIYHKQILDLKKKYYVRICIILYVVSLL